jgi:hypothetical protein
MKELFAFILVAEADSVMVQLIAAIVLGVSLLMLLRSEDTCTCVSFLCIRRALIAFATYTNVCAVVAVLFDGWGSALLLGGVVVLVLVGVVMGATVRLRQRAAAKEDTLVATKLPRTSGTGSGSGWRRERGANSTKIKLSGSQGRHIADKNPMYGSNCASAVTSGNHEERTTEGFIALKLGRTTSVVDC